MFAASVINLFQRKNKDKLSEFSRPVFQSLFLRNLSSSVVVLLTFVRLFYYLKVLQLHFIFRFYKIHSIARYV